MFQIESERIGEFDIEEEDFQESSRKMEFLSEMSVIGRGIAYEWTVEMTNLKIQDYRRKDHQLMLGVLHAQFLLFRWMFHKGVILAVP